MVIAGCGHVTVCLKVSDRVCVDGEKALVEIL